MKKIAPSIISADQEKSFSKSNTEYSSFLNSKKAVIVQDSRDKGNALPVIKGNIMSPSKEPLKKKLQYRKGSQNPSR